MSFDPSNFTVAAARPIPVILLLDGSGSMHGENIESLNRAVNQMISSFKDESTSEVEIEVAIIRFGGNVDLEVKLTKASNIDQINLKANGGTPMGTAISMAKAMIEDKEVVSSKGYRPTVVLVSDGQPTDDAKSAIDKFIGSGRSSKCDRMAMSIGGTSGKDVLEYFLKGTENNVFSANDASKIKNFFQQVTMSVSMRSRSTNPNLLIPQSSIVSDNFQNQIEQMCDF